MTTSLKKQLSEQRDAIASDPKLREYYCELRKQLNSRNFDDLASNSDRVQRQDTTIESAISLAGKAASAVPIAGQIASAAAGVAKYAAKKVIDASIKRDSKEFKKLNPAADSAEFAKFTRELATMITTAKRDEILRTPDGKPTGLAAQVSKLISGKSDSSHVAILAQEDAKKITEAIFSGKLGIQDGGIEDPRARADVMEKLFKTATETSKSQAKEEVGPHQQAVLDARNAAAKNNEARPASPAPHR
jgi:hypothetical protein